MYQTSATCGVLENVFCHYAWFEIAQGPSYRTLGRSKRGIGRANRGFPFEPGRRSCPTFSIKLVSNYELEFTEMARTTKVALLLLAALAATAHTGSAQVRSGNKNDRPGAISALR